MDTVDPDPQHCQKVADDQNWLRYLVGVYDEDGCGEREAAAQQPVLVQAVQLLQVGQRDAGLLTPPTRLHPFQRLDITTF